MSIRSIARTAILLALTILFQSLGRFIPLGSFSQFIVGPLVNACLIVAAAYTGLAGGAAVAVLAPFGAILTGASIPLPFAPFIAIGNFVLVLAFYLLKKKPIAGLAAGAVMKFGFLFGAANVFAGIMKMPAAKANVFILSFSWPQLVTAIVGGIIALLILTALRKAVKE